MEQDFSTDPFFFTRDKLLELYDNYEAPQSIKDCPVYHDKGLWPELKMESFVRDHNANRGDNFQARNQNGNVKGKNRRFGDDQPEWGRDQEERDPWGANDAGYFDQDGRYVPGKKAEVKKPTVRQLSSSDFTPEDWTKMRSMKVWVYTDVSNAKQGPFSTQRMASWFGSQLLPLELPIALDKSPEAPVYEELQSYFFNGTPFETMGQEAIILMARKASIALPADLQHLDPLNPAHVVTEIAAAAPAAAAPVAAAPAASSHLVTHHKPVEKPVPQQTATQATTATTSSFQRPPVPAAPAPWAFNDHASRSPTEATKTAAVNHQAAPAKKSPVKETSPVKTPAAPAAPAAAPAPAKKEAAPAKPAPPAAKKEEPKKTPAWGAHGEMAAALKESMEESHVAPKTLDKARIAAWQKAQRVTLEQEVIDFLASLRVKEEFIETVCSSLPTVTRDAADELRRIVFGLNLAKGATQPTQTKIVAPPMMNPNEGQSGPKNWTEKGGKNTARK